jgi:hypothetical protein
LLKKPPEEFDTILEELDCESAFFDDSLYVLCVDLGVKGLAAAVSAFGCAPGLSCRGHPNREDIPPQVAFWSRRKPAEKLKRILEEESSVQIENIDIWDHVGGLIYAPNILDGIRLAKTLQKAS